MGTGDRRLGLEINSRRWRNEGSEIAARGAAASPSSFGLIDVELAKLSGCEGNERFEPSIVGRFIKIGLDWTGLDWIGLDWIGLDHPPRAAPSTAVCTFSPSTMSI